MFESASRISAELKRLSRSNTGTNAVNHSFVRDPSTVSENDIQLPKLLQNDANVEEQTLMQIEVVNDGLQRKSRRTDLAGKGQCLTRRWQSALTVGLVIFALAVAIGGLAYWISIPKVITQPFLLYGESCMMNSRACDETRMLWCPAGTCVCLGNFHWNATSQNCSCGQNQAWNSLKCQDYGYYGDPCNPIFCQPTLTCIKVVNQTYTTGQDICVCDNVTYLVTSGPNKGKCLPRLTHNALCETETDCQDWLGLSCTNVFGTLQCRCSSTNYWNGSFCARNAFGWESCGAIPCDTSRGLSCVSGICECDQYHYWDNVTTQFCEKKKTYAASCLFDFQCNTTINLTCPINTTSCNCPVSSGPNICDCQTNAFWDGQRCITRHIFNGTCPGQYACGANLVCHLGHCICPGNMVWNSRTPNACDCFGSTNWNSTTNTCV